MYLASLDIVFLLDKLYLHINLLKQKGHLQMQVMHSLVFVVPPSKENISLFLSTMLFFINYLFHLHAIYCWFSKQHCFGFVSPKNQNNNLHVFESYIQLQWNWQHLQPNAFHRESSDSMLI